MILSPETVAEQVMICAVGAAEMIPSIRSISDESYSVALIPQGSDFYTGLLQAAGYLLLDRKKKKLLIISEQQHDNNKIIINTNIFGPTLGKSRKFSKNKMVQIAEAIGGFLSKENAEYMKENIVMQLPFIKVITEIDEYIHISIGIKTPQQDLKKITSRMQNNIKTYNIVLMTNIELSSLTGSQRDTQMITKSEYKDTNMLEIFQNISHIKNQKPKIIGYVNSGNLGSKKSITTRYVCAMI